MSTDPTFDYGPYFDEVMRALIAALDANYVAGERKAHIVYDMAEALSKTGWEPDPSAFGDDPWVDYGFKLFETAQLLRQAARERGIRSVEER